MPQFRHLALLISAVSSLNVASLHAATQAYIGLCCNQPSTITKLNGSKGQCLDPQGRFNIVVAMAITIFYLK